MSWDPAYQLEEGWLTHRYGLMTGNVLRFMAKDVKHERTGTHAAISISLNWVTLAWSTFNVERDEDRVRLANSAYKHLDGDEHALDRSEFPANLFKHGLDLFCQGLWDEIIGQDLGGWLKGDPTISPARPLLGSYVLRDAGSILYSPPGNGKSYTALAWAVCLQYGVDSIWPLTDTATPCYINLERSEASMAARLGLVNAALGLEADSPLVFLNKRGRSLSDVYESAKRTIEQNGCDLVVFDSISRSGAGTMNGDEVANRIMDMLNALCPTWLCLAHSPRGDESHIFGSQMFDAAADIAVQLKAQTASDGFSTGIGLEVTKANDIRKPPLAVHVFEWGDAGLVDIRRSRPGEFSELEATQHRSMEDDVATLLITRGSMASSEIADELGRNRSNIAYLLAHSPRFTRTDRDGKKVLYGLKSYAPDSN